MPDLEAVLRARRDAGGRAFVPYVTGGYPGVDASLLRAIQDAGADAIEVGIPFSDPVMDGGVIQEASRLALEAGARPADILATIAEAALDVPVAVMTYVNPVYRHGFEAFLDGRGARRGRRDHRAGPPRRRGRRVDGRVRRRTASRPCSSRRRARRTTGSRWIAKASTGFLYCVATYGVTGVRDELAGTARRARSSGSGRSRTSRSWWASAWARPAQAAEVGSFADGAVVGTRADGEAARGGPRGHARAGRGVPRGPPVAGDRPRTDDNIPQGRRFRIGV